MTLHPRKEGESIARPVAAGEEDTKWMTPAEAYVRSLGPGYYMLSEVADTVGVASQTLRRLIKDPGKKIKAPSFIGELSGMKIYVFTEEDVKEVAKHYQARYEGFEKRDLERGPGRPKSKKAG